VALVAAAPDVPPADGGVVVVGEEVAVVDASVVGGGLDGVDVADTGPVEGGLR
jgi:hypothetical protein